MYAAILISYNPNISTFRRAIASISKGFDLVVVHDNYSENVEQVSLVIQRHRNVKLIEGGFNKGVKGLNDAADIAISLGADYISVFDQDSVIPENFTGLAASYFSNNPEGVCAPLHIDLNNPSNISPSYNFSGLFITTKSIENFDCSLRYIATDFVIGSGMTMNKEVWGHVSGFCDDFFLDCADFSLCFRLIGKGYKIHLLRDCIMEHEIGEKREKVLGLIDVSMHPPIRHYYYFKSMLTLIFKRYSPRAFKNTYLVKLFFQYFVYSFLISNPKPHRKEINRAIVGFFSTLRSKLK